MCHKGLETLTDKAAKSLVQSVAFIKVIEHEFLHAFDTVRSSKITDRGAGSSPVDDDSKKAYYNDPAEFNAYYHDIVKTLTNIANSPKDDLKDYAELYGFTGNFQKDLQTMLKQDRYTRSFVEWLNGPRRKALLRRIYKMHQHVMTLIKDADKKTGMVN